MELVFGYLAGLLTLINPCVLPVLPIVLATALQAGRMGPIALAAGMSLSFVTLGLLVSVAGRAFGITEETVSNAGAVLMIGFGLVLVVPRFSAGFATATAGFNIEGQTTFCPGCGEELIRRDWHTVISDNLTYGSCKNCKTLIDGVF